MEYAKQSMTGGYRPVKDIMEADYVVLSLEEYRRFKWDTEDALKKASDIEAHYEKLLNQKDRTYYNDTQRLMRENRELSSQVKELSEANSTYEADVQRLSSAVELETSLNENLKRIARERANARRGIKNKKEHDGYIVLNSQQYTEHWTEEIDMSEWRRRNPGKNDRFYSKIQHHYETVWKSTIQTPHDASIPYEIIEKYVLQALWEDGILEELGCLNCLDEKYNGTFHRFENDENGMYKWTYSANYKAGFWEVIIYTTKQLVVPAHRMPEQKKK